MLEINGVQVKKVLLTVYRSLIRSILDYGAIVFDSMSDINKQKLDSVQAQALRIACGAARGTSAALQVQTGEPPLQLRRLQLQLQYAVKVKALKDHPASKVFQPHWMNRTRKYNENTDPIYNKVFTFLDNINISECETVFPTLDPPWRRKKCKVHLSVSTAGSKEQNPTLLCALANERLQFYGRYLHVFTDASN